MNLSAFRSFWRSASPLKRALVAGLPLAAIVGGLIVAVALLSDGGGADADDERAVSAPTAQPTATTTPDPWLVLAYLQAIAPTPTPEPVASSGGGGGGTSSGGGGTYVPRSGGTGPGAITGTGMSMSIPAIGVNARVYGRTVGSNGQMGNPSGAWDVIWYDFAGTWSGLGGFPGEPGANAVFAGHVDYIRVGPAVFWSIRNLAPGDQVTVTTANGPITYVIQWSAWAGPNDDFTSYVAQNGTDMITLVTCIGGFSGGHYSNRLIVRGVRI